MEGPKIRTQTRGKKKIWGPKHMFLSYISQLNASNNCLSFCGNIVSETATFQILRLSQSIEEYR